jgi:hypothetical protein
MASGIRIWERTPQYLTQTSLTGQTFLEIKADRFENLIILVLQPLYLVLQKARPCPTHDDPAAKLQRYMIGKQPAGEYDCPLKIRAFA